MNNQDLYLRQDKLKLQFSQLNSSVKNIKNKSLLILQKVTSKKKIVYRVCALQFAMMTVLERLENEDAHASMTTTTTTRIQKFAYPAIKNNTFAQAFRSRYRHINDAKWPVLQSCVRREQSTK